MDRKYELMLVLNARPSDEEIQAKAEKFLDLIKANGELHGEPEDQGRRRLAYEIDYEKEGYYFIIQFMSNTNFPKELERNLKIDDQVLRYLITRVDEE